MGIGEIHTTKIVIAKTIGFAIVCGNPCIKG